MLKFRWSCNCSCGTASTECPNHERTIFKCFELEDLGGMQHIVHFSEQPEYRMNYTIL